MAGEGGFKVVAFGGFDKDEVNEYISNLRKKMQEMEAENKANAQKAQEAEKSVREAEDKINAVKAEYEEKVTQLEARVKTERRKFDNLQIQCDDLKRKLRQKGMESAGLVQSSTDADNKQSAAIIDDAEAKAREIIDSANATARDVVEKANATAKEVVDKANATAREVIEKAKVSAPVSDGATVNVDYAAVMAVINDCMSTFNSEFNSMSEKVSNLLSAEGSVSAKPVKIETPEFVAATAPVAEAVQATHEKKESDDSADFAGLMDSSDTESESSDLDMFGMENTDNSDEEVTEVQPVDTSDHSKATFDDDFTKDLIANTVPSSSLGDDVDADLLEAVRKKEQEFAVTPTDEERDDVRDFDMGSNEPEPDDSAEAMKRMLAEAEAAFGSMASAPAQEEDNTVSMDSTSAPSGNEWADLQKQLEEMEKAGNLGESGGSQNTADDMQLDSSEDPKAPDADDSSIWDFGSMDMGESNDDDMSSDLFGNF